MDQKNKDASEQASQGLAVGKNNEEEVKEASLGGTMNDDWKAGRTGLAPATCINDAGDASIPT